MQNFLARRTLKEYYNRYSIDDKEFLDFCGADDVEDMWPQQEALAVGLLLMDGYIAKEEYLEKLGDTGHEVVFGAEDIDGNYGIYEVVAGRIFEVDNLWS